MSIFLLCVEFISAIFLVIGILLHSAKGEGLGAIGGNASMFHSQKGMEDGLNKFTTIMAITFLSSAALFGILF